MYPEKLNIEPTKRSPLILLEPGRIFVLGRSILDNPSEFYEQGLSWISDFTRSWTGETKIYLGFEYINTGSIKWLYIFLKQLADIRERSDNTTITWYYEQGDDDMCELGFILRSLVECPFTIVEVEEMNQKLYQDFMENNN